MRPVPSLVPGFQVIGTAPVDPPSIQSNFDRFKTTNHFYGGQLGVRGEASFDSGLSISATAKVGLGVTQQLTIISGGTSVNSSASSLPGGLYAQPSNIGRYYRSAFAVVPEVGATIGYNLTEYLRASVGYTFLYWSNVARPGQTVDGTVNSNLIPTFGTYNPSSQPGRPAFVANDTDFWAHGINFGLELRY